MAKISVKTSANISAKPHFAATPKNLAPEALAALGASLLTQTQRRPIPMARG